MAKKNNRDTKFIAKIVIVVIVVALVAYGIGVQITGQALREEQKN